MRLERIRPVENLAISVRTSMYLGKKREKKRRNKSHHDSIYLDTRRIKVILLETMTKEKKVEGRIVEFRCDNVTFLQWGALHTRDNESILAIYEVNEFPILRSRELKIADKVESRTNLEPSVNNVDSPGRVWKEKRRKGEISRERDAIE